MEEPCVFATDETAVKAGQCGAICKRGAKLCVCRKDPMGHVHKDSIRPTQAELDVYKARYRSPTVNLSAGRKEEAKIFIVVKA